MFLSTLNDFTLHRPDDSALSFVLKGLAIKLKDAIAKRFDPVMTFDIGGRELRFHLSHRFPSYYTRWPNYDRALPRLCELVKELTGI
jgi:hypothetical protein